MAITEDENEISLRDASSTKERPKLDGFDMDEDTVTQIEVSLLVCFILILRHPKKSSPSMQMLLD